MCGILGIVTRRGAENRLSTGDVLEMRDTMRARGPDDAGLYQRENISFAHRRLAIRDIAGGKQPWVSPDGRYVLVYNGEIYNDDVLRDQLQAKGFKFRTTCDTEVLMAAWQAWGKSCVYRLRGMFAFGIADTFENEWWLVRDRCGVKPLYYSQIGNDFVFASSIKAIARHPGFSAQPDLVTLRHYLSTLRLTMDQRTVFKNVQIVRPAEIMHGVNGKITSETYWSPEQSTVHQLEYEEAVGELETRLRESVSMRLKSDVPVGMMLSGGVDSNLLASLTSEQTGRSMVGCCGGGSSVSSETDKDDFHHAALMAKRVGFDYDEVRVSPEQYRETWQHLLNEDATPLATPTDVIIYNVSKRLKRNVGVALGGEGADEAFCGYSIPHWSGADFDRSRSLPNQFNSEADLVRASLFKQYGRDRFDSPADHYLSTNGLIPRSSQNALFRDEAWGDADSDRAVERHYDGLFQAQAGKPMVEQYAHVLFRLNLESLLGRLDRATMAASLEARVPYTDHHVIEQAFRLPHAYKIDVNPNEQKPWLSSLELAERGSLRSKRVLRSVAARWMPESAAQRPKMSFPTPLASWLHTDWKPWLSDTLERSSFANEIFQPSALADLKSLPAPLAMWNWPIVNLALWGDQWFH